MPPIFAPADGNIGNMRAQIALLIFILAGMPLRAQQVEVTRYDLEQGLPQSMVNHVLQDVDGFIWLGTGDGIARFDGQRFVVYKHDPRDSTSISNNRIWGMAEADGHHLWVGTRTGLDRLDRRTGRFEHLATGPKTLQEGCWHPVVVKAQRAVFYSALNSDMITIKNGVVERRSTGHRDSYCFRMEDSTRLHMHMAPDSLITFALTNGESTARHIPVALGETVTDMLDIGGRWLILTDRSGWIMNATGEREELPDPTRAIMERVPGPKHIARTADGNLWVGLSGVGICVLRQDLSIDVTYTLLPENERPLVITTVQPDRQGNVWIGTDGKGVFKIAPQRIKFGRAMPGVGLPWQPASWFVRGFAQWDPQRVLVSFHQGGLALFDERTGELSPIRVHGSTPTSTIMRMINDTNGLLWMSGDDGVFAFDPASGQVVHQRTVPTTLLRDEHGHALLMDADSMWTTDRREHQVHITGHTRPVMVQRAGGIPARTAIDPLGHWWTSSTVLPIDVWGEQGPLEITGDGPLPETRMMDLVPAANNEAWMTTTDGLYRWSLVERRVLQHFTIHEGLPDQFLYGMVPAGDGTWWISSNNGLSHFDPSRSTFRNYGVRHGLQSHEFNSSAAFRSSSGRIYFGGVNGFNHFIPTDVHADPDTAVVHIVHITSGDSAIASGMRSIELPFGRNDLTIELAVLEFSSPEEARYAYMLEGYDTTWSIHAPDHDLYFENLPHGEYRLLVKGMNADGLESVAHELLTINVPLPFWASPWAYVLVSSFAVLMLAGMAFLLYGRRVKQRLAYTEQQMKDLRVRTRIAQDLHDDVGSGLARITALARMAEKRTSRGEPSTEQVSKVGVISQELMDNLRDVVWVNDPRSGELADLLLRTKEHVRDLFEPNGVQCTFALPDPLPERTIGSAFKRNVFLIMKEAAHNAGKYSGTAQLELSFTLNEHGFDCTLRDHGKGLGDGTVQGSGNGLANMRERAGELGATLMVTTAHTGGTEVRIGGPIACLDL